MRDNQARHDVDEKTTRGPDERARRTDSTDGLDERSRAPQADLGGRGGVGGKAHAGVAPRT